MMPRTPQPFRPTTAGGFRPDGKYTLGDLLGKGRVAEVFAGHAAGAEGFEKPVAIKRLVPEFASDRAFVDRLIGQAKRLVQLRHSNLVSVLDLVRDGDDVYLVLDLVDGPSVRRLLDKLGDEQLPLGIVSQIIQSAAQGLAYAHSQTILHGGLTARNVLLTTFGEVRVSDLTIARCGSGAADPSYLAPEQLRGEKTTPRSDVYALGVVLYELITGVNPFELINTRVRAQQPVEIDAPSEFRSDIPPAFEQLCMKALSHDPDERYPRVQDMIDAIVDQRYANGWREQAADVAAVVRKPGPANPASAVIKTMITARPLTILTQSLLAAAPGPLARGSQAAVSRPVLEVNQPSVIVDERLLSEASTLAVSDIRGPFDDHTHSETTGVRGTPAPRPVAIPPALEPDLAEVHGGAAGGASVIDEPRFERWGLVAAATAVVVGIVIALIPQVGTDAAPALASRPAVAPTRAVKPPPAVPKAVKPSRVLQPSYVVVPPPGSEPAPAPIVEPPVVEPPAERAPHGKPRARESKPEGALRLSAYPWAWVSIDGGPRRDMTGVSIRLPAGRHTLRITNDEGFAAKRTVIIRSDRTTTIRANLEDATIVEVE
jgi:hypothetical protein